MTYDTLILLQNTSQIVFTICLIGGVIYLAIGLIRPGWLGLSKRIWVVLRSLAAVVFGFAVSAGTLAYTHAHPNGPHAFIGYMQGYVAKDCAAGKSGEVCDGLRARCARPTSFPACVIYREELKRLGTL
ncbi:MAG: hypothetical protein AAFV69_15320 [Pseudomonadota bacterium]